MADIFTKEKRSWIMSRIKSKWTKQEVLVHNYLKGHKIRHRMHPKMFGSPDIILLDSKTAIFLHGCFWHGCPKHYREPNSRKDFWKTKIKNNVIRDQRNNALLRKNGWRVLSFWEHDITNKSNKIAKLLESVR
jgi:DNA mismatch endonuclease (patch repair protein)